MARACRRCGYKTLTRGEIWLARRDAALPGDAAAPFPCLVVSPSELSDQLDVVTVAPVKPGGEGAAFRIAVKLADRDHRILLEQLMTLDKRRLTQRVGALDRKTLAKVLATLREMFAE